MSLTGSAFSAKILVVSAPGKTRQNAFAESFNGRLRDECLKGRLFTTLGEAKAVLADWCDCYNRIRVHSSLANHIPAKFAKYRGGSLECCEGLIHRPIAHPDCTPGPKRPIFFWALLLSGE